MKKFIVLLMACLVLFGCVKKPVEETPVEEVVVEEIQEPVAEEPVLGGWQEREDQEVTEDLLDIFKKGVEATEYADYVPVKLLATQVVYGTNFKFLCENGEELVIYRDLNNDCFVLDADYNKIEKAGQ